MQIVIPYDLTYGKKWVLALCLDLEDLLKTCSSKTVFEIKRKKC